MQETKEVQLKRELQRAVEVLVEEDDDDCSLETTDHLIHTLSALKILKLKKHDQEFGMQNSLSDEIEKVPQEFRCPISGLLMKDPVVLASGQTYDRPCIQKWLKDGHQKCPQTDQPLPHTLLTSNHSIKNMIFEWRKLHQLEKPSTIFTDDEEYKLNANQEYLITLLERLSSSSVSDTKETIKELRILTNKFPSFRALFGDVPDSILRLFNPLLLDKLNSDEGLHEDLAAIVLNISIHENNKKKLVEETTPSVLSFLIGSLMNEKIETRSYAAAALSALSDLHSNKHIVGKSGVIKPLIGLVEEGHPLLLRDSVSSLLNLLSLVENREVALSKGIVPAVMSKIIDHILVDEMLEILALLSSYHRAMEEMEAHGLVFLLFNILREKTSEGSKENCVAILYNYCFNDRVKLRQIGEMENAYETLCQVARSGNARAKRKAKGILERLNRFAFFSISHTA